MSSIYDTLLEYTWTEKLSVLSLVKYVNIKINLYSTISRKASQLCSVQITPEIFETYRPQVTVWNDGV